MYELVLALSIEIISFIIMSLWGVAMFGIWTYCTSDDEIETDVVISGVIFALLVSFSCYLVIQNYRNKQYTSWCAYQKGQLEVINCNDYEWEEYIKEQEKIEKENWKKYNEENDRKIKEENERKEKEKMKGKY